MKQFGRLVTIVVTVLRFGLDEVALSAFRQCWVRALVRIVTLGRRLDAPRGERLRQGLERLGPIFVKFGQVLSTRRAVNACARGWKGWGPSSSSSARCCRPGAT